jgi:hypothetical protein
MTPPLGPTTDGAAGLFNFSTGLKGFRFSAKRILLNAMYRRSITPSPSKSAG